MAFFSFIGWVLLVFFGGMGLFAIPWDLVETYRNRPIKRSKQEILAKKSYLQDSITDLIQRGQGIEGKILNNKFIYLFQKNKKTLSLREDSLQREVLKQK